MSASKLETSGVSAEISTPAGPGESDPEPISEKTEIEKGEIDAANDVETSPKKSLAFKLAFVGLASSLFVFQLDATALGIALPVSNIQIFPQLYLIYFIHTDIFDRP